MPRGPALGSAAPPKLLPRARSRRGPATRKSAVVTDDGQRVPCGQPHRPLGLATREAGALDEPGRGELDAAVGLRASGIDTPLPTRPRSHSSSLVTIGLMKTIRSSVD
jgi:hypothetical protein